MLQRLIGEDVRLQLHLHPAPLLTHADAGMMEQVLMNLAVNACDAMRDGQAQADGACLRLETSEEIVEETPARKHPDAVPGRYACLSVTDNGCGIPAEVQPRIFEPFFTTKEPGKGTGLGLATVFGIVKQHRGWITVQSQPECGTTFQVFLPANGAVTAPGATAARPQPRGGSETILLAEDETTVRKVMVTILTRHGYKVLEVTTGEEALNLWVENRASVSLLVTDLVMPGGVSGRQLARRLQTDKPALKVLYIRGYSAEIAGREIQLQEGENFVQKPFRTEDLLRTIRSCLDG
jgi:CheY-like chemotaxis protein